MTPADPEKPRLTSRASRAWRLVLAVTATSYACGGRSASHGAPEVSGTGGTPGAAGVTGSTSGETGAAGANSGRGGAGAVASEGGVGAVIEASGRGGAGGMESGAGGDAGDTCNLGAFWAAIALPLAPLGMCGEASPMLAPGETLSKRRGAVVIDAEGRAVDNTGLKQEDEKQEWLEQVSDQRWLCLAGQTIGYKCYVGS